MALVLAPSLMESQMKHANVWTLVTKQEEIERDEIIRGSRKQLTT